MALAAAPPPSPGGPGAAPRPRGNWVAFFVVLTLLAGGAAALPVLFNLRQQLRLEQVESARERWRDHAPASYDLEYTVKYDREPAPERYLVLVRDGRIVFAARDGQPLHLAAEARTAAGALAGAFTDGRRHGIEAAFAHIETILREEAEAGRRNYVSGIFDATDGHPKRFVYRVRGTDEREEWNFLLSPPGQAGRRGRMVR
jgi:hypothetical protein